MATDSAPPPHPDPDPGWTPIDKPFVDRGPEFVSGDPTGNRIRVRYYQRDADRALVGKVWFGPGAEGPPGNAHGGSVAAVLDEAMGYSAWLRDVPVVAATITVHFRRMLPLNTWVVLEAWIDRQTQRRIRTRSRLTGPDGRPFAEADGLFIRLAREKFHELRHAAEQTD